MDSQQLTEELSLKALTALSNVISDYEAGYISKAQASTGVRAVFDAVGGIVNGPVLDIISAAAAEYSGVRGYDVDMVGNGATRRGIMRECGTGNLYAFQCTHRVAPGYDKRNMNADKDVKDLTIKYMERLRGSR